MCTSRMSANSRPQTQKMFVALKLLANVFFLLKKFFQVHVQIHNNSLTYSFRREKVCVYALVLNERITCASREVPLITSNNVCSAGSRRWERPSFSLLPSIRQCSSRHHHHRQFFRVRRRCWCWVARCYHSHYRHTVTRDTHRLSLQFKINA